jgi:hypothetical protein
VPFCWTGYCKLLPCDADFQTKQMGHMTKSPCFQGDFIASGAKAQGGLAVSAQLDCPGCPILRHADHEAQWRMTVKKLMMIAALVACASPALAGSYASTWGCKYSRFYGYNNCRSTWTKIPDPVRDPEQERLDAIAQQREDARWEEFCKPTFRADEYGVRHAAYAKRGCEFGRSE